MPTPLRRRCRRTGCGRRRRRARKRTRPDRSRGDRAPPRRRPPAARRCATGRRSTPLRLRRGRCRREPPASRSANVRRPVSDPSPSMRNAVSRLAADSATISSPSGVIAQPLGKWTSVGDDRRGAVGAGEREHARRGRRTRQQVVAEVADVGVAARVDDHVVALARGDRAQIGEHVLLDRRRRRARPAPSHRHDEQVTVRRPPQTTGLALDLGDGAQRAVGGDRQHPTGALLGEEQLAGMPPRALRKGEVTTDHLEPGPHNSVY